MKKIDLAYTAALLDGEGSITIGRSTHSKRKRKISYWLSVNIKNEVFKRC